MGTLAGIEAVDLALCQDLRRAQFDQLPHSFKYIVPDELALVSSLNQARVWTGSRRLVFGLHDCLSKRIVLSIPL